MFFLQKYKSEILFLLTTSIKTSKQHHRKKQSSLLNYTNEYQNSQKNLFQKRELCGMDLQIFSIGFIFCL